MKYYIGIDNSSLDHKVHIIDQMGIKIKSFTISNNLDGFKRLYLNLRKYKDSAIAFELPHGPLIDFLRLKDFPLYSLNPLKVKRFKESIKVSGNKNDKVDAEAISFYLLNNFNQLNPMQFNSGSVERLKILALSHSRLTKEHTRYNNKLIFVVRQYFPLYERLFSRICTKIQLKMIIEYPTFSELRKISNIEIENFLKSHYYRNPNNIQKVLFKINSYNQIISEEVEQGLKIEAQALARIILSLENEIARLELEMNKIVDNHSLGSIFQSLPGAGRVLSAKLLAIFGDVKNRFNNANGVQCLFGTAPRNYQSGPYHKIIMRKACNKIARAVLYKYSFSSMNHSKWAREYYDNQRKKGKTNSVAIRALSNKWVRIIYKIWKDEIFYEESKKFHPAA